MAVVVEEVKERVTQGMEATAPLVWVAALATSTVRAYTSPFGQVQHQGRADQVTDASVTQSALEEALASKMQDGGTIGSRMSTISQAIRSRYLPKTNNP